ncbi:MAG: hypothetical protein E6J20_09640 [Chloroflexi bacterium]|nr:MAG: hypothetical protein E6J20_09640 [Chloroflexota bacterium]
MSKTERDPLGPGFGWRLRSELDRVQPRFSTPRYLNPTKIHAWRLAPAALALALTGFLGLTAYAATGSANPAVWTERIVTVVHPVPPTPTPEVTPTPPQPKAAPAPKASAEPTERPEPTSRPAPTASPEPRESPEPGDEGSGSDSNDAFPTPTPTPGDH